MKRTVAAGFLAAVIAMLAGGARSPSVSPSFQYVIAGEGDVRGMSTDTAHPGSRQLIRFSDDNLTIAASIEVEEIRGGVALVKVRTKSYPGVSPPRLVRKDSNLLDRASTPTFPWKA